MQLLNTLTENFSFDEKEARIYLAALELGKSRVSEIAHKADINRITTYEILKRFQQEGIASSSSHKNVIVFSVLEPDELIERMERRLTLSKEIIPQLLQLKNRSKDRPKIEYYDGTEGIRSIYTNTLSCKEKVIYNVAAPENLISGVGEDFFKNYVKKRIAKDIMIKVLIPETEHNRKYIRESHEKMREIGFFDPKKYKIPNEIIMYDNKTALLSFSSKIGVVIDDVDITQSMKAIWNLLWDVSRVKDKAA